MLTALLESMETGEFEDDGFVHVLQLGHAGSDIRLTIETGIHGELATHRTWSISCTAVRDFRLLPAQWEPVELVTAPTHPAIRQHVESCGALVFTGSDLHVAETVGELLASHVQAAQRWIPFERYLNQFVTLDALLAGGFGELARGPLFLLEAYSTVLRSRGCFISPYLDRPAVYWDGSSWCAQEAPLSMLRLGESFVVAERFAIRDSAG